MSVLARRRAAKQTYLLLIPGRTQNSDEAVHLDTSIPGLL